MCLSNGFRHSCVKLERMVDSNRYLGSVARILAKKDYLHF